MNLISFMPILIIALIVLLYLVIVLVRVSNSRSASRIKSLTRFSSEGISLAKPLQVEFGVLRAIGYYSKGYHVITEFLKRGSAFVDSISYKDLCSDAYLLAVDWRGIGYLVAPAVKIVSRGGKNVVIMCLDPLKTPKISKLVEVVDSRTRVESEVKIVDGRYVVKASWPASSATQWRVVYDEKKGVYTITTEPAVEVRVRNVLVKLCVKSSVLSAGEICRHVLEVKKPGEEVLRELEGLQERRVFIEHLDLVNLASLARSLGITTYPHISGYAENMIRVKLVLNIPFSKDVVKEEVI